MLDGVIKFQCEHTVMEWGADALPFTPSMENQLKELDTFRTELFDAGFIGIMETGIGYGNISLRCEDGFIITASGTGGAKELGIDGYGFVETVDIERNTLSCKGPLKVSSESMSHAAVYESLPEINCVVHVHNALLFSLLLEKDFPATSKDAEYGTTAMAKSIMERTKKHPFEGGIVMTGHEDGVIFYGMSLTQLRIYIAFIMDIYEQEQKNKPCKKGKLECPKML